jgi:DivIVA domain-containing protein
LTTPRKLSNEPFPHTPELTQRDIAYKEFKKEFRGYNKEEVDNYLSRILLDYAFFEKHFTNMANELNILRASQKAPSEQIHLDNLDKELQQIIKNSDRLFKQVKKQSKR